jgi:hypothetical protein
MTQSTPEPFQREEHLDKPGIIGARWWQRSLENAPDVSRRQAVQGMLVAGGVVAGLALVAGVIAGSSSSSSSSSSEDYRTESKSSLEMQKEFGWSFGATTETLTFDGVSKRAFDRGALPRLPDDLRPARPEHARFYVPTLFQSPAALPRQTPREDTSPPTPLKDVLAPISTPAMDVAYKRGQALASLFKGASPAAAVIVDLPGPEAVAFAAGAASVFDPVFLLDNWPHPRGVVPAHRALAAAVYYQPLFAKHSAPSNAPPLFVLDRQRLSPYADDTSQFDNRHLARLPNAAALKALGYKRVLYVAPLGTDKDLDDINDDVVLYASNGLEVRLAGADAFAPDPSLPPVPSDEDWPPYYYGGAPDSHLWFWTDYPWVKLPLPRGGKAPAAPRMTRAGVSYTPVPRTTPFSSGKLGGSAEKPRPPGFGTVPVIIAVATGAILGAKLFRSGSWNRTSPSTSRWGG